jgi:hypothetical protein
MASTRFDFAPPPAPAAGGLAVPIDVQRVEARLRFNPLVADTLDATVEFVTGPVDGFPVFDLRQTVRLAWLDGEPVPPDRLAHHDLGGGPGAEMRVIERVLPASTAHALRVVADLGPPQVRTDKNRRPVLLWDDRRRLTFRFGFTDRRPARYLESWVPSNLIFDEFALVLHVWVDQTDVPHRVITNGEVEEHGFNRWTARFPSTTASFAPLFEIMAADRLESARASVALPTSGRSVAVEVWRAKGDPTSLDAVLQTVREALPEYEARFGPYPHGDRFVVMADVDSEGMEYAGGATGDLLSMRHEIAHSWFGRGVYPASQPDSWFDEAVVIYAIDEANGPRQGFADTNARRVAIAPATPWSRVTVLEAYAQGSLVFAELATLVGPDRTESILRDLMARQIGTPLTTQALEELVVRHVPRAQTVNLFHRLVHGLPDPPSPPRLAFPGTAAGSDGPPANEAAWDSPSLWVRNDNDGGTEHQSPERGRTNWVLARVRNDGPVPVAHSVVVFRADPTPIIDPGGPVVSAVALGASVQRDWVAGEERLIAVPWEDPVSSPSFTISAQVLATGLPPSADPNRPDRGALAWKTRRDDLAFSDSITIGEVALGNRALPYNAPLLLELTRSPAAERASVVLSHPTGLPVAGADPADDPVTEFTFPGSPVSSLPLELPPSSVFLASLLITLPDDVASGEIFRFDLVARRPDDRSIVAGAAFVLTAP